MRPETESAVVSSEQRQEGLTAAVIVQVMIDFLGDLRSEFDPPTRHACLDDPLHSCPHGHLPRTRLSEDECARKRSRN